MSLRVWLPLTKDLRQQGLSNVTVTNNGATYSSTGGKLGGCYIFDGVDDAITVGNLSTLVTDNFSFACWFYHDDTWSSKNYETIFGGPSGFELEAKSGSTNSPVIRAYSWGQGTFTYELNKWNHLVMTRTTTETKFYLNGELKLTGTAGSIPSGNYFIGSWSSATSQNFKGKVNDVRIYNHCLSPMEVKQIAQGLILHYPLDRQGYGQENLLPHSDDLTLWSKENGISVVWDGLERMYKMSDTTHTSSYYGIYQNLTLSANTTYTLSVEGKKVGSEISLGFKEGTSWPTNGSNFTIDKQRLSITITIGNADASCRIYLYIRPTSGGNNYGYFSLPKLEIGETITPWCPHISDASVVSTGLNNEVEYDNSGYCNNGIKTGTFSWTSDTPKYAVSTNFDTTTSIISSIIYDKSIVLPEYTVATWAKISENPSIDSYFYKGLLDLYFNSSGKISYMYGYSLTSGAGSSFSYNLGEWIHIAATRDSAGTLTIYLNGVSVYTRTRDMYARHTTDALGYDKTFTGQLSDFRIYVTALSADDIKSLYQNCATIDSDGTIRGQIRS